MSIKDTVSTTVLNNITCEVSEEVSLLIVVLPSFYIPICIVGLIGNGLVLGLLILNDIKKRSPENKRSVTNVLIINLALADFIFVGALPFWITERFLNGKWLFGLFGCKFLSFMSLLNLYGSVFFLVAMSVDRYIAIVYAIKVRNYRTPRNAIRVCVIIWLFASIIASQALIFREEVPKCGVARCIWSFTICPKFVIAYFVIRIGLGFLLPFTIIVFCYIFIITNLQRRRRKRNEGVNRATSSRQNKITVEGQITKMIMLVISVFVVCWLPNHILTLLIAIYKDDPKKAKVINTAMAISSIPAYANSCLNPIVYAFMKDDVRTRVIDVIRRIFKIPKRSTIPKLGDVSRSTEEESVIRRFPRKQEIKKREMEVTPNKERRDSNTREGNQVEGLVDAPTIDVIVTSYEDEVETSLV